jgi:hypothetical protein
MKTMGRMKTALRFNLVELLCAIALVGGALAVYRTFWVRDSQDNWENCWLLFGIYIAVVSAATCRLVLSLPHPSGFIVAFTIFGWAYLVFVLQGGFGVNTQAGLNLALSDALARNSQLGLVLAILSGLVGHLWQSRHTP